MHDELSSIRDKSSKFSAKFKSGGKGGLVLIMKHLPSKSVRFVSILDMAKAASRICATDFLERVLILLGT